MIRVPPTLTYTPLLFQVCHIDTMHMTPKLNGCRMILHARDALTNWVEACVVKSNNTRTIAKWIFEDIICRWRVVVLFVSDNTSQFAAALDWLRRKYRIRGIKISAYNSQVNGSIEKYHWDIRQILHKATGGDLSKWFWFLHHTVYADHITIKKNRGCSPFFMVSGAHPLIPLDLVEATWLTEPPEGPLSTADLLRMHAKALAKH